MSPPQRKPDAAGEQRRAITASRCDRDRALEAIQALEMATGSAGPGRDADWRTAVIAALDQLQSALAEQRAAYDDPASLMLQLAQDDPRLRTLVRQLRHRWKNLEATADSLANELREGTIDTASISLIREQVRWLVTALHHHRAREADLIYAALQIDIVDPHPTGPYGPRPIGK
jgi:hypothetical protein